jgi:N-acetyltransferase 10
VTWLFYLQEHIDYDVVKSANPEFKKATVRINIFKQHRQTIQVRR